MIPLPWLLVAALVLAAGSGYVGFGLGKDVERLSWVARDLATAQKVIVKQEILVQEVPKIVTKYVERKVEITKEVERVVTVAPKLLAPDCVLPDGFGMLLVAAANGLDPETSSGLDAIRGSYGCNATLAAILTDLEAGWKNTAQLQALQQWADLVSKGP